MIMKLPKFILPTLLKLHAGAARTPYYHIDDGQYMVRNWLLGARSPERNKDNPRWKRPGFVQPESSQLYRWICNQIAARAHTTNRSDKDRHLHDHPAWNVSVVLEGGYWELCPKTDAARANPIIYRAALDTIAQGWIARGREHEHKWLRKYGIFWRGPGDVVLRKRDAAHKLILPRGVVSKSIFIIGKKDPDWHWGFYVDGQKVYWKTYLGVGKEREAA